MRSRSLAFMLLMSTALTGCATFKPPLIGYDDEQPAVLQTDPPKPVQVVELPKPLPCRDSSSRCRAHDRRRSRATRASVSTSRTRQPESSRAERATSMPCRCFRSPTERSTRSTPRPDR